MDESIGTDPIGKETESSSWLEKLARKIPGFSGYLDKKERRQADQLIRETISARLEQSRLELGSVSETLSADIILAIDHAEPIGRADNRLMGLIGKIKDAPSGYSSFFDANQVDEATLDQIYMYDSSMIAHVDQISSHVKALQNAVDMGSYIGPAIKELDSVLKDSLSEVATRNEIIKGIA
ncbi:MAG: hypothetical protein ACI9EW_002659 [Cellvibrionaceae bacterium]|jgi:hypothetical protein